ncbi:serine O-acetyltransferase [Montanilutibacter psychrotolerans]|uniref:Serine acetyltransferase n=1 Tax=Montanilutibacter psychrotolerans TaxID=1327343 RepID=A0A3M8SPQ6_9GAMM|nr:serine acetyltransferase [Lysobacter psychrotolerans]RNF83287.1 serine acetyltransferase [Lysobacter psychrotolerans]
MTFKEYRFLVLSDLYRITGHARRGPLLRYVFRGESFRYNFWLRTCAYARSNPVLKFTVYPFARFVLGHLTYKLGISIPVGTVIGSGFYIGHFGGIVVSQKAVIGRNCNISQGVTIGRANRGKNKGYPVLGDNIYIGPGAVIAGNVRIGSNVAIGANCVVAMDIPDDCVVAGVPGTIISRKGSTGYVNRTDYDGKIG